MTYLETGAGRQASAQVRADAMRVLSGQAGAIVDGCAALAAAFRRGATLFVAGTGQAVADAQHVAVEFVHPVIVGKPALPAVSLANDPGALSAAVADGDAAGMFAARLRLLARPGDALLAIAAGSPDPALMAALAVARDGGLLTLLVAGETGGALADHTVLTGTVLTGTVLTGGIDGRLAKESDVTAYHLLWELTHVALEHADLVAPHAAAAACDGPTCITCSDGAVPARVVRLLSDGLAVVDAGAGEEEISVALVDASAGDTVLVHAREAIALVPREVTAALPEPRSDDVDALYPFLAPASADDGPLRADLLRSTEAKIAEAARLREECVRRFADELAECARAVAQRVQRGGRLLTFGNGGSSTDAQSLAALYLRPGGPARGVPALCLTADVATLTAMANDVGFEVVFSRQIASMGRPEDVAVALSTSGNSDNVIRGLAEARRRGLLTVGFAGSSGGQMASAYAEGTLDHLFVVPSASVHRIQEAQATLYDLLWEQTQLALGVPPEGEAART